MENCCSGGVFIGSISLVENFLKACLSIIVLLVGIPCVAFAKDQIHADIYVLIGTIGVFSSVLLICGSLNRSSGKVIWWICFQGVSIFHQIFFSIDVVYTLYHRVISHYLITICMVAGIILLLYVLLEIQFMYYIVQLYQEIAESEMDNTPRVHIVSGAVTDARDSYLRERTDRNNPMQSSIIKLLAELEGTSDTVQLIK